MARWSSTILLISVAGVFLFWGSSACLAQDLPAGDFLSQPIPWSEQQPTQESLPTEVLQPNDFTVQSAWPADESKSSYPSKRLAEQPCCSDPAHCRHGSNWWSLQDRWQYRIKPWLMATHWGYPENFVEPPLGVYPRSHARAQIAKGLSAQLALYNYDFHPMDAVPGTRGLHPARLNTYGHKSVAKIARLMRLGAAPPVVVEPSGNEQIDAGRRFEVLSALTAAMGTDAPNDWVVVGEPAASGLAGVEAAILYQNLILQTAAGGAGFGGSGLNTGVSVGATLPAAPQ